ncbi:MAG: hypothetical protein KDC66_03850 [Phaeodactylibacter sp.]|nr:hypothetical protein [Phaeodactylibacter sp.]MCB9275886.1 hypothetical protein [Lewinellaceae bacterium]
MGKDRLYKLSGLFILALFLFNFPIVGLLGKGQLAGDIPLSYLFLFLAWGILIFLTMRIVGPDDSTKP